VVTVADIESAARRIAGSCIRTPVLPLDPADVDGSVLLKVESLQPTGAFKIRGATNAIRRLAKQPLRGVITHSSGNHGQAVAAAAAAQGIRATIVMPADAPAVKLAATRRWGAEVVRCPAAERVARCIEIAERTGAVIVAPYEDEDVIAGQGTIGLEILEQVGEIDTVLVPVGGGGLISGIAVAVKALSPSTKVVAVEPELAGDLAESFELGRRTAWTAEQTSRTIADGVRSTAVGELNWSLIERYVDDVITVSEVDIMHTMRTILSSCRIVVEPSGAVATAAYLAQSRCESFGRTVAIVSGGNVDHSMLRDLLA
jgi:threonine dehydratase